MKQETERSIPVSEQSIPERRTRTQGEGAYWLPVDRWTTGTRTPGTITWFEHEAAWKGYHAMYPNDQDAECIAARGGFGYWEAAVYLGHEPRTWLPLLAHEIVSRK